MKKLVTTGVFSLLTILLFSQSNTVASGGDATGTGGSVSYTIGQIDYQTSSNANGTVSQGVQQPYEIYPLGIKENAILMSIYPNPTTDILKLELSSIDQISYQLVDAKGKILINKAVTELKTDIEMKIYASGTYFLTLLKSNTKIESTKIIKH